MNACRPTRRPLQASPEHVAAFKALAHLGRLRVFFHLVRAGGATSVGEIRKALDIPAPTLSHHLESLRRAGLVTSRREERFVYDAVDPRMVSDLVRLLSACC
ncbi:MAG TPA: metalloregulator ArsR/SmtB family transcription factor [Planctomycetota bacterium]|nr:metalloregulator ArsR/SmtB family transcription factor [Planctomycetota bacterium]